VTLLCCSHLRASAMRIRFRTFYTGAENREQPHVFILTIIDNP
jgi:hypothetical protein